jgi:uncharacterized protein YlxW (UPF0749 family)
MRKLLPLLVVSFIFGFLLTFSLSSSFRPKSSVPLERKRNLIKTIKSLEKEREDLKSELKKLREEVSKIEEQAAEDEGFFTTYQNELKEVKAAVGLLQAEGPGLIINISDNPNPPPGEDPNNYIVHDYDLRILINALLRGGAEAISINNQRVVFSSSLRCVGTTVLCNAVRLAPPYEIKAIGDPEKMIEILNKDADSSALINHIVPQFGLIFKLSEAEDIVVPGYSGSVSVREAQVYEK